MIVKRIGTEARAFLQREKVMTIAVALAVLTSLVNRPKLSYINFQVLSLLFCLMLVISGFKKLRVLDYITIKLLDRCDSYRAVNFAVIGITFFTSMLVTNDVALLTFVPLTLTVGMALKRDMVRPIIWQTLAANLGSALTPMGNPQNLFLYSYYNLEPLRFLQVMLPLAIFSLAWLIILILRAPNFPLELELPQVAMEKGIKLYAFSGLFLLNILAVLRCVDHGLAFLVTILVVGLVSRKLFRYVDYSLLLTFVGFFIFVGNISTWPLVVTIKDVFLGTDLGVYLTGIFLSQFISNVPAAMLLAGFTDSAKALLLSVNVGGLGTLIASMASVISYKLYQNNERKTSNNYLRLFIYYNTIGLLGIGTLVWLVW